MTNLHAAAHNSTIPTSATCVTMPVGIDVTPRMLTSALTLQMSRHGVPSVVPRRHAATDSFVRPVSKVPRRSAEFCAADSMLVATPCRAMASKIATRCNMFVLDGNKSPNSEI